MARIVVPGFSDDRRRVWRRQNRRRRAAGQPRQPQRQHPVNYPVVRTHTDVHRIAQPMDSFQAISPVIQVFYGVTA